MNNTNNKVHLLSYLFSLSTVMYSCEPKEVSDKTPIDQQGVYGTITDYKNDKLLEKVTVILKDATGLVDTEDTQSDGAYSFGNIRHGNYSVFVEKNGYVRDSKPVKVGEGGGGKPVNFALKPIYEISPNDGLEFGATSNSKKFDIVNNLDEPLGFKIINNNKSWFIVEPLEGKVSPNGNSLPINITVNRNGVPSGTDNTGSLTINFDSYPSRDYRIAFDVPNNEAPSVTAEKVTNITPTTAQIAGTITNIGKGPVLRHGHVWGTKRNPECCVPGFYTDLGARGIGQFVSTLTGLKPGETYYVRAYAENEKGRNYSYNQEYEFTTPINPSEPSISLVSVNSTSSTTAKAVGKINDNGGSKISVYGFVWSKTNPTPDPDVEKTKIEFSGEPTNGDFTANLANLEADKSYYIIAYAKNSSNPKYGKSIAATFNTPKPIAEAKLTATAATNEDYTTATLKGSITDFGTVKIVEHGVVYSKSNSDPKINAKNCVYKNLGNVDINKENTPYPITAPVTGLFKGMSYYYRTYTKNENGDYSYSPVVKTFVTKEDGRVVHLTFNGNAEDVSGNGNNANSAAQLVADRFSNQNGAYDLSKGTIQLIKSNIADFTGEITTSIWVNLSESNFNGGRKILFGKDHSVWCDEDYKGYFVMIEYGSLIFWYRQGKSKENSIPICSKEEISDGKWHHLTITKAATTLRFYIDGEEIRSPGKADYDNIAGNLLPMSMGNMLRSNGCWWGSPFSNVNALIDDFRIYYTAFSPAQVLDLYNRER